MAELFQTNLDLSSIIVAPAASTPIVLTLSDAELRNYTTATVVEKLNDELRNRGDFRTFIAVTSEQEQTSPSGVSVRSRIDLADGNASLKLILKRIADAHLTGSSFVASFDGKAPGMADEISVLERAEAVIGLPKLIARINDESGSCIGFVKSYFDGETLESLFRRGEIEKDEALQIFMQIYDRLAAQGWYIWDHSLENIILRREIGERQEPVWIFGVPDTGAGADTPPYGDPKTFREDTQKEVADYVQRELTA